MRSNPLTPAELNALTQPLSNEARVLYCLGLRPEANASSGASSPLNYKHLLTLVNGAETRYHLGRHINGFLQELVEAGLLSNQTTLSLDESINGKSVVLPLMLSQQKDNYQSLHEAWGPMKTDWVPESTLFDDLAHLVGIIDKEYSHAELGEFIAYWLGRPQTQLSPFQWTQKFVFHVKQKRLASGVTSLQKVGSQLVKPKPALEVDDNARKLMEKYSNKSEP